MEATDHDVVGRTSPARSTATDAFRFSRRWPRFGLCVAVLSFLSVACSNGAPESSPSGSATTARSSPSPSESSGTAEAPLEYRGRGYSLTLPKGWSATESSQRDWTAGERPDKYVGGFTTFTPPDSAGFLAVGSRPVAGRTTPAQWQRQMQAADELDYPECEHVEQATATTLDDSQAARRWYTCESVGAAADLLMAVHQNRGWVVVCAVPLPDKSSTHQTCERRLSGFRFTP